MIQTSTGYPCMHLGDTRSGSITHNVCRNGQIRVYGGNQNVASQNMIVQNNAASIEPPPARAAPSTTTSR